MEIRRIDGNTQFKGYVDRSLVKFINSEMKAKCHTLAVEAASYGKTVDPEKILSVKKLGNEILTKLSKFMNGLHEKTSLTYERMSGGIRSDVYLENPICDRLIDVASTNKVTEYSLTMHSLPGENLEIFNNVAERLLKRNPMDINKDFLKYGESELKHIEESYNGIFRMVVNKKAKALDKFAAAIGDEKTTHKADLDRRFELSREIARKRNTLMSKSNALINKIFRSES